MVPVDRDQCNEQHDREQNEVEILGYFTNTLPFITCQPFNATVYSSKSATFVVLASGYPTNLTYQWYNGASAISGANGSFYTKTNAQVGDTGQQYSVVITNAAGSVTSIVATLTVITNPRTNAYPLAVLADNPIAYWPLNEGPDDTMGNNGKIAYDVVGGHSGVYSNIVLGAAGYRASDPDTFSLSSRACRTPPSSLV